MDQGLGFARVPQVEIRRLEQDYCEFVLTGTDPSVANALRRVMIAEVWLKYTMQYIKKKIQIDSISNETFIVLCNILSEYGTDREGNDGYI